MRLCIDDKLAKVYCLQPRKEQARSSQDIRFASLSLPPGPPGREASQRDDGKRPGQPPSPWPCDPPRSQGRPKRDSDHAYRVCLPLLGSPHLHVGSRPIASLSLPPGFPSREASQGDCSKRPDQLPLLGSPHPHVGSRPIASLSLPPGFPSREASQGDCSKRPDQPPLLGSLQSHVGSRPIASLSLGPGFTAGARPCLGDRKRPRQLEI